MLVLTNTTSLQGEAKPAGLRIRTLRTRHLGTCLFLNKTNLSSSTEHISEEEEMGCPINIIKYRKD